MGPDPRFWSGKRVAVTGGTGFLGYHLVRQLLALGARVRVLALPPSPGHPLLRESGVEAVFGDVREAGLVRQAVGDCDAIFHTAGVVAAWGCSRERMDSVHVTGTCRVLEAARPDARVVHTSSVVSVGASRKREPLTEDSPFELHDLPVAYVHSKRAAERVALTASRIRHVVVTNPGYLVGPEDHEGSIMGRFCARFWNGRLPLAPSGGLNLVDVRDVARGHLLAAEHGRAGRRYILGGENATFSNFMALMAEVAGLKPRLAPRLWGGGLGALATLCECRAWLTGREPYPSFQHAHLNRYYWFYHSGRAAAELGYRPRPLGETLADTYRWYAAEGRVHLRGLGRWWMRPASAPGRAA